MGEAQLNASQKKMTPMLSKATTKAAAGVEWQGQTAGISARIRL